MGLPDFKIDDTSATPCNCPRMECPIHEGALCPNGAAVIRHTDEASGERHEHHLGDQTMADGIHLCRKCGEALAEFFIDEIVTLMGEFTHHVPQWMKPLETLCRTYYKERSSDIGWVLPYNDAKGVLALAYATVKIQKDKVPAELVDKLLTAKTKLKAIVDAYEMEMETHEVHVSHE